MFDIALSCLYPYIIDAKEQNAVKNTQPLHIGIFPLKIQFAFLYFI